MYQWKKAMDLAIFSKLFKTPSICRYPSTCRLLAFMVNRVIEITMSSFTFASIYITDTSGAEKMPEINNSNGS